MNESDFEQQLRAIPPAAPRRALEERIAAELSSAAATATLSPRKRSWLERLLPAAGWGAAGAMAGIVITLALDAGPANPPAPPSEIAARLEAAADADMELEHEVLNVAEAGIIGESEDGFARVVRYESLERRRWVGNDGAVTVVEVPREDLVFVPVSIQ